jgi:hypothetical protein
MNIIGIRVQPSKVYYTIISPTPEFIQILDVNAVKVPASFNWPEKLKYIRRTFYDIIDEYKISKAGMRQTEAYSKNDNNDRVVIEGVIQELFASSSIEKYFIGGIVTISAKLHIPHDGTFKELVEGKEIYNDIEGWNDYNKEEKESILTCFAAFNL